MIEDDEAAQHDRQGDGELLLYDYFKHLTSLVLFSLGGLVIVIKDLEPGDVKPQAAIIVIVLTSAAGILSFAGAGEIARARYTGTPRKWSLQAARVLSPALLAVGLGYFLAMFIDSLN